MKKYAIVMILAAAVGLTACGNGATSEAPKADSTQVDSTVVAADTTATVDTTATK
jgi:major membrane immunogen (membrane-anchored lipoprotein)